jgi:3-isopropylmalate dehydratase small subunit
MKKENFIQECLNTAEILENLKNELLNVDNFDYQLTKLIQQINQHNYRIEIHNDVTNVRTLHKQNKCIKTIVSFWEKAIKKDMLIVYKDNTIMYKNEYYDKDYSIDDIIEAVELQQTNCYGTTI